MAPQTISNSIDPSSGGSILWGLVLSVHLLAMAAWLGGAAYIAFVQRPSLGLLDGTQRNSVQLQTLTRYFRLVWHVIPLVLVTGWLMLAFPLGGFNDPDWHVQAMQGLGVIIALLFAYAYFRPLRKVRRAVRPLPADFDRVRSLVSTNLYLGILVIVIASLDHVF